jgi:tRNA A37 threonylcarbamoyladenosine synthetase subunit TsaC/SUA5/YrdC
MKANLEKIPLVVTAGTGYVGVRFPKHEIARKLIELSGPIAAPSANLFTHVSPTSSVHVFNDFYD